MWENAFSGAATVKHRKGHSCSFSLLFPGRSHRANSQHHAAQRPFARPICLSHGNCLRKKYIFQRADQAPVFSHSMQMSDTTRGQFFRTLALPSNASANYHDRTEQTPGSSPAAATSTAADGELIICVAAQSGAQNYKNHPYPMVWFGSCCSVFSEEALASAKVSTFLNTFIHMVRYSFNSCMWRNSPFFVGVPKTFGMSCQNLFLNLFSCVFVANL